jgi:hypothetical protein
MSDTTMTHHADCRWETADCSYRETHHYCPHPEHACNCRELRSDTTARPDAGTTENDRWAERKAAMAAEPGFDPADYLSNWARLERAVYGGDRGVIMELAADNLRGLAAERDRLEAEAARLREAVDRTLRLMREPMTLNNAHTAKIVLTNFVFDEKKAARRRALTSAGEEPNDRE